MKPTRTRVAVDAVRVFTQRAELTIDLPALLRATHRYFDATLEVLSQVVGADEASDRVVVELHSATHGYSGRFALHSRRTTEHDLEDARDAERRGRAAGMASLAERCPTIWEVVSLAKGSELALLNLCGILTSVALGPALPDDGATLFGVRGSMERVARLLGSR